jgi:hypothetical protein
MPHSQTSGEVLEAAEHHIRAVKMRIRGDPFREIGPKLGRSPQRAHQLVMAKLQRLTQERLAAAEELRTLELERYDLVQRMLWPKVLNAELTPIQTFIRLSERRAKALAELALKRRSRDSLHRAYQAKARELFALQQRIKQSHAEMDGIWQHAAELFPSTLGYWTPDADGVVRPPEIDPYGGVVQLHDPHLVEHPPKPGLGGARGSGGFGGTYRGWRQRLSRAVEQDLEAGALV